MLQHQRHQRIIELVKKRTTCTVDELCNELGISAITLYRDLRKLDDDNLIRRVRGGVTLRDPDPTLSLFEDRVRLNASVKDTIGKAVAGWIREGTGIFIDASSTTYFLAKHLAQREVPRLTLVTTSPGIPLLFERNPEVRVISTGGEQHRTLNTYGGPITMRVVDEMNFDAAYVSCAGFSLSHGATTDSPVLVELLRGVARRAAEVVLLIDSSKFSRVAIMTSLRAQEITRIVTDDQIPSGILHRIQDADIEVMIVGRDAPGTGNETEERNALSTQVDTSTRTQ